MLQNHVLAAGVFASIDSLLADIWSRRRGMNHLGNQGPNAVDPNYAPKALTLHPNRPSHVFDIPAIR